MARGALPTEGSDRGARVGWVVGQHADLTGPSRWLSATAFDDLLLGGVNVYKLKSLGVPLRRGDLGSRRTMSVVVTRRRLFPYLLRRLHGP